MLITIDQNDPRPIYRQIVSQIKYQAATGDLKPGDPLPGVRELARRLEINLHTVHRAYRELREAGVIHLRLGKRATVAPSPKRRPSKRQVRETVVVPLREIVTEALHMQLRPEEIHKLVDEALASYPRRRATR